ncbi:MAG TPA: hypothetical protein VG188_12475, partial [Solirubrobacteraceae bacterium]|nr:hypothetical protein [Solirubrobacteraceae bacterium]
DELIARRERLRRLDALCSAAGAAAEALGQDSTEGRGAGGGLAGANASLEALAGVDPHLDALAERLRALSIESDDLAGELRGYCEEPELGDSGAGEPTLDGIEERLTAVERLMRKHGGSIERVLEHAERSRARRDELAGADLALEQTAEHLAQAQEVLDRHVQALREARLAAVPQLEQGVREQLASLAMPDATFAVQLDPREAGPSGGDAVEFQIAPNPGVPAGPLREIASGGELSRVMLALATAGRQGASGSTRVKGKPAASKTAPAGGEPAPPSETLVFDEIDAGIGGHAARAVGARLRELAEARQVLCITHLPQIASLAERHFSIAKETSDELARTSVVQLAEREVVSELVRMLGADTEDTAARRHARDLRRAA